jgi:lipoprotein NlpI
MRCLLYLNMLIAATAAGDAAELLDKARAAFKKSDVAGALKLADKAVAAAPADRAAYLLRGQILMANRDFAKSVLDFSKVLELDPKAAVALDQRGTAYFKMGKIKESLADFDRFIALRPQAAAAHWRRGLTLYYAREFAKGVAQFTTSDQAEPNDVENAVWHYLCNVHVKGLDKARAEMPRIAKDPRGPYFMKIYEMFQGKAKPADVLAAAEAGKANDDLRKEQRFYAHYYIGMYYESVGEAMKSLEELKTAVERYPIGHYMMDVARVHIQLRSKESGKAGSKLGK